MKNRLDLLRNEELVRHHQYTSLLPVLCFIIGTIIILLGLIVAIAADEFIVIMAGIIPGLLFVFLGAYLRQNSDIDLVITTKRVFVDGPYNRFVSLPLNQISGVTTHGWTLHVGAAGGHIFLSGVADAHLVRKTVIELLNEIQPKVAMPTAQTPSSAPAPAPVKDPRAFSVEDYWVCAVCGEKNAKARTICWNCDSVKGPSKESSVTSILGKKRCASCGNVLEKGATVCSCGSAHLSVITPESVEQYVKPQPKASVPSECPDCNCGLVPFEIDGIMVCPNCGKTFG